MGKKENDILTKSFLDDFNELGHEEQQKVLDKLKEKSKKDPKPKRAVDPDGLAAASDWEG